MSSMEETAIIFRDVYYTLRMFRRFDNAEMVKSYAKEKLDAAL